MNASKALHHAFAASPHPVHGPPGGRPQEKQPEVVTRLMVDFLEDWKGFHRAVVVAK